MKINWELVNLIEHIFRLKPMYGINNVFDLGLILDGYCIGRSSINDNDKEVALFANFTSFVSEKYDVQSFNYKQIIHQLCKTDEESLLLFSQLFNEYLTINNITNKVE